MASGVYVSLDLTGQSGNTDTKARDAARVQDIGGHRDRLRFRSKVLSEADIIDKCGTGSGVHDGAAVPRPGWKLRRGAVGVSVGSPSGTAQTKFINIIQRPSAGVLQITGTGAASAGFVSWWIDGIPGQTIIANGDTYATIMQNMVADIQAAQDFMRCTATYSGGQVLLTARTANLANADFRSASSSHRTQWTCRIGWNVDGFRSIRRIGNLDALRLSKKRVSFGGQPDTAVISEALFSLR